MVRIIVTFLAIFCGCVEGTAASAQTASSKTCIINIGSPVDQQSVRPFTPVEGRISADAAALGKGTVWVIIHPDGDFYWVQRPAKALNLAWRASTQFGIPATPKGFHFEVMAFVAPFERLSSGEKRPLELKEGDRLSDFPEAECATGVVHVFRE